MFCLSVLYDDGVYMTFQKCVTIYSAWTWGRGQKDHWKCTIVFHRFLLNEQHVLLKLLFTSKLATTILFISVILFYCSYMFTLMKNNIKNLVLEVAVQERNIGQLWKNLDVSIE